MTNRVGRPRKFFTEDELALANSILSSPRKFTEDDLILAKKILLGLKEKPNKCICGSNQYIYGYYSGSGVVIKCCICGHRKRYIAQFHRWGK